MYQVISAQEAVKKIKDGATVVSTGFIGSSFPEYIALSMERSFLDTGHPKDLTISCSAGIGNSNDRGFSIFGHEGMIKRAVCGHYNLAPALQTLVDQNKIEAYLMPQGTLTQLYREIGAGRPGVITKIGLGTLMDPRIEGGKCNEKAREDLIESVTLGGEEYLWYKSFHVDAAIIRGTSIDENGNLTIEKESTSMDQFACALAAKHCGGIVIAEVERIVQKGSYSPRNVQVPGVMIDYAVIAPQEHHHQHYGSTDYDPALAHEYIMPVRLLPPMKMCDRKIIGRRAAMELKGGSLINLGIGVPEAVSLVAVEEGFSDRIIMSVESGQTGGVPSSGLAFGGCYNPDYVTNMTNQFDFYDGGGLYAGFLGCAEVDAEGNVNVTKFKKTVGPGGFINIAQSTKNMFFCGTLTAGGAEISAKDGRLTINKEGKNKKFVKKVQQISFSGRFASQIGQNVMYITERAVFRLTDKGVELTEIAPGIDLKKHVLDVIEFDVHVSPELKTMDERIFIDKPMGLTI